MSKQIQNYRLSKALRFRIGDDGLIYGSISHSSGEFYIAPEVLFILVQIANTQESFDVKRMSKNLSSHYKNQLECLPNNNECESILKDLVASGLVLNTEKKISRELQADGFGDSWIQWAMISDVVRCNAYEKAILSSVNKKSIVADVGAGCGFLTSVCLGAGVEKVIAIEETQIAQKIMPFLKQLKLPTQKDKLILLNENSFDVQLPQNITHVVSELFGNDPFQEGVLPTLRNIAQKFKQQPEYIPQKITLYFEFINILEHPIKHRIQAVFSSEKNSSRFLAPSRKLFSLNNVSFPLALEKSNFKRVSKWVELGKMPLNPPPIYENKHSHPLFGKEKINVTDNGNCVVGLLWYRVNLTNRISLSNHPQERDAAEHWSPIVVLIDKSVHKNDELVLEYGLNELETQFFCKISLNGTLVGSRV